MLVVDSSAILEALAVENRDPALIARLAEARELHAPHLIDVELLHALRRLVATGGLTAERAAYVREDLAALRLRRYAHEPLSDRVWALRDNLTAYDGAFVALAEALRLPLATCDGRLAAAPGLDAEIELYGAAQAG